MMISIGALLIALCVFLASGAMAIWQFRRARKMKTRAIRAEAGEQAYKERLENRSAAEAELRTEMVESRDEIEAMKEVKTDEEAVALIGHYFDRAGKL